jgi:hypothetical protein
MYLSVRLNLIEFRSKNFLDNWTACELAFTNGHMPVPQALTIPQSGLILACAQPYLSNCLVSYGLAWYSPKKL